MSNLRFGGTAESIWESNRVADSIRKKVGEDVYSIDHFVMGGRAATCKSTLYQSRKAVPCLYIYTAVRVSAKK